MDKSLVNRVAFEPILANLRDVADWKPDFSSIETMLLVVGNEKSGSFNEPWSAHDSRAEGAIPTEGAN